jgi:Tfp pilus assembly protein PilV
MKRQQGFIFIEVLIATIIISIGLVAVATIFVPATINYGNAADYTVATNLAQKQIELLKAQPISFWNVTLPFAVDWQGKEVQPINLNTINYQVTTKALPVGASNSLVEVQVTVSWLKGNKPHTMQVVAFFSKK